MDVPLIYSSLCCAFKYKTATVVSRSLWSFSIRIENITGITEKFHCEKHCSSEIKKIPFGQCFKITKNQVGKRNFFTKLIKTKYNTMTQLLTFCSIRCIFNQMTNSIVQILIKRWVFACSVGTQIWWKSLQYTLILYFCGAN